MLKALYDYARNNQLTAVPGFKNRAVDAYISLDREGNFLDIVPAAVKKVFAPDLGSTANGTQKCNILISKAEYVLCLGDGNIAVKHAFFKSALQSGADYEPMFGLCFAALEQPERLAQIQEAYAQSKFKAGSNIGFQVDGIPIESSHNYEAWWQIFRKEQCDDVTEEGNSVCVITGVLTVPMKTVPKVTGLQVVGGHTSGDAVVCFDKAAFCSYGLEKSRNAAVSEEAITAVNAALESLLKDAPIHANTKLVHWYKESAPVDYMQLMDFDFLWGDNQVEEPEETEAEGADQLEIRRLARAVWKGESPVQPQNVYYILPLSGGGGRVMVRGYEEGTCAELHESFSTWFHDLSLCTIGKSGMLRHPKLPTIYRRLLKPVKVEKNASDRMKKELSGLDTQILYSIIKSRPLPDSMAVKALAYIRSDLYGDGDAFYMKHPDSVCCQILKAWLIRRGKPMATTVNYEYPSAAYQCGRLFAVYAAIQRKANPDVNVGVVERYYASASVKPAFVLGKLASLSHYHLSKLDSGSAVFYQKMLNSISCQIALPLPNVLTTEEQSEFALGYYQQCAEIFKPKTAETTETEE